MMAGSVRGEGRRNGGGSGKQERRVMKRARARAAEVEARQEVKRMAAQGVYSAWAYHHALKYAHRRAYISLAVKASGLLAALLSTVILLGGYVASLLKKDFFCIMVITVIQGAGIFQDWENNLRYIDDFKEISISPISMHNSTAGQRQNSFAAVVSPVAVLVFFVKLFYLLGPLVCAAISSWCIAMLNHSYHSDGTDSMADMMATLNIFYSLIIFQGALSLVLLVYMGIYHAIMVHRLYSLEQLPHEWGKKAIDKYLSHISNKCRKDPLSIQGMDLSKYAAELLDSELKEDYQLGAMLLCALIDKGRDVSRVLLTSKKRIKKLVDSLWLSSTNVIHRDVDTEIRELATTIVVHLADCIDLAMYPGALRYISYLLQEETEHTYCNVIREQAYRPQPPQRVLQPGLLDCLSRSKWEQTENLIRTVEEDLWRLMRDKKRRGRITISTKLILNGLAFLERLASNRDNRTLICSTPGLLPKITAPLYSETLIRDMKYFQAYKVWANIVTGCLKVLYQLIDDPDLPREVIFSQRAMSNLEYIILVAEVDNEALHQLQLVAMEILTKLALDFPMNITLETKGGLIRKQLQLFLFADGDVVEESTAAVRSGRTLVSLSTNSENAFIMATTHDVTDHLTGILDDENITRRTIAAEIMANLCARCNVDNMKEILSKVLREIMFIETECKPRKQKPGQNNLALGDEQNQENAVSTNHEERQNNSRDDHTGTEEISGQEREEQEAFLSLAQVICRKLNSEDLDDLDGAIQNASEQKRRDAFVNKLKMIIDDNSHATPDCLRIVKLCCQIALSVMRCEQYVEVFRNKGFMSSLSKAWATMCELESCMLFLGTDFGLSKNVGPLFSEINESFRQILHELY